MFRVCSLPGILFPLGASPLLPPRLLLLPFFLGLVATTAAAAPKPNVLLITMDTTRADYLGTYGSKTTKTPHLDALASRGARFDMALSASAVTPVSHATISNDL